jgi:tetratricopeptide (TPR) repeat protein
MLLALYVIVWRGGEPAGSAPRGFDPFEPRARVLAQRLGAAEYQDALPLARELEHSFPADPELLLALARIWHGLRNAAQEVEAWERYVRVSPTPAEACPALAEAYQSMKDDDRAVEAYERCVRFDSDDPDRWFDLAQAYERQGRRLDALTTWRRAAALDPDNPWIHRAIAQSAGR